MDWLNKCVRRKEWWNGKRQTKAKTRMGEIHHRYIWYDDNSKLSGGGQAKTVEQRRPEENEKQGRSKRSGWAGHGRTNNRAGN